MSEPTSTVLELFPASARVRAPASPFLKWAGGKTRLLRALVALLPPDVDRLRYLEPFLGGGAMFFRLAPTCAVLSDINPDLIATYLAVRDELARVLAHLTDLARAHDEAAYYEVRQRYNAGPLQGRADRAATFIYLNKTCFNGLHRVNKHGHFNVPVGRYADPAIVSADVLRAASVQLRGVELRVSSFETLLEHAGAGDFVYLDPPYAPHSATALFTSYARQGFGEEAQAELRAVFGELNRRGARLMLSNSDVPLVRELYRGFQIDEVRAPRSVNSKSDRRGSVGELVIRNYGGHDARAAVVVRASS